MSYSIQNIKPERLSILLKVGMRLAAERNLDRLLAMIIEETTAVMSAERSSLFLIDAEKSEMWAKIAQGVDVVEIRFPVGTGIAGTVGKTGELINIPDAYQDARFNPEFDKKTGFRTRSILCVPLKNIVGETIGAIQGIEKWPAGGSNPKSATILSVSSPVPPTTTLNPSRRRSHHAMMLGTALGAGTG